MRLVTVKEAAKVATAYEKRHGRKEVTERHVRWLIECGRLAAHRLPGRPMRGPTSGLRVLLDLDFLMAA
jgi:hypothetical protein